MTDGCRFRITLSRPYRLVLSWSRQTGQSKIAAAGGMISDAVLSSRNGRFRHFPELRAKTGRICPDSFDRCISRDSAEQAKSQAPGKPTTLLPDLQRVTFYEK